jgi:hypothetical protein
MPGIAYTLGLDPAGGIAGLKAFQGALGGLGSMVSMLGPIAGIAGGLGLAGAAVAGFKKSIDEAAQMEGFVTGFKVFLGSADAAKQRMQLLADAATQMPFELPQVVEASKNLQIFSGNALSTGKGLAMVGDIASATGRDLATTGETVGRLYQLLTTGVGEPRVLREMEEMGAISGVTAGKLEKMVESGQHGMPIWNIAAADLSRFGGMMGEQMGTWNGMMTNFRDSVDAVFREFGTPILDQIKPILADAIHYTDDLKSKAHQWGAEVAWGIGLLRNLGGAGKLSEFAGLELKVGFADAVGFLGKELKQVFGSIGSSNMFSGLSVIFDGLAMELTASISKGITSALSSINILGHPLLSPEIANLQMGGDDVQIDAGSKDVKAGIDMMSKMGGVAGSLGTVLKGLTTDTDGARKQLAALEKQFGPDLKEKIEKALGPASKVPAPALPPLRRATDRIKPLTDRLSQIGLFIGGNGGPKAEQAAQATAKNTEKANGLLASIADKLVPQRHAGATF